MSSIIEKDWEEDVKKYWRYKLYRFVEQIYGSQDPEYLNVACLPGKNSLEVYEVYKRLGIPDDNIYGIEKDEEVAEEIKKRAPGINLYVGEDSDFFDEVDEEFDIISLDYTGQLTESRLEILENLSTNSLLKEKGIMVTNFYGMQEHPYVKKNYETALKYYLDSEMKSKADSRTTALFRNLLQGKVPVNEEETAKKLNMMDVDFGEEFENLGYEELADKRSDAISQILLSSVSFPISQKLCDFMFKHHSDILFSGNHRKRISAFEETNDMFEEVSEEEIPNLSNVEMKNLIKNDKAAYLVAKDYLEQKLTNEIIKKFNIMGGPEAIPLTASEMPINISRYLIERIENNYLPFEHERHKYKKETGTKMYTDFLYFKKFQEAFNEEWIQIMPDGRNKGSIDLRGSGKRVDDFLENLEEFMELDKSRFPKNFEKRTKLNNELEKRRSLLERREKIPGLSPENKDSESKEKAIDMILNGSEDWEIMSTFPKLSAGQLRAFKAHKTMGTYSEEE